RAFEHAFGGRPGEVNTQATDLTDRGDSGPQRGPQVAGAARRPQRHGVERKPAKVEHTHAEEMAVAVPHARHHRLSTVHHGPIRGRRLAGRTGVADHRIIDDPHSVADRLTTARDQQFSLDPLHLALLSSGPANCPGPACDTGHILTRRRERRSCTVSWSATPAEAGPVVEAATTSR